MVKVSVLYPLEEGGKFDMDYYCNSHLPMVLEKLGSACKGVSAEEGMGGAQPGSSAPYVAIGHIFFNSLEEFQSSFGPNVPEFMADVPNYTNIEPIVQISNVRF